MKFNREYFVHYYDCDTSLKLHVTSLLRYFEDIALLHSEDAGVGLKYYHKNKIAWLIYKWDIIIEDYPCFTDSVNIITEPHGYSKFYAYRTFDVRNKNDEQLIKGNSIWFLVDTNIRRPTKITEELYGYYNVPMEDRTELKLDDIGLVNSVDNQKEFFVRQSDIDTNDHVNNIKYVEWALEAIPTEILKTCTMKRLKVVYKKETHFGKKIKTIVEINEDPSGIICRHKIMDEDVEVCLLETHWAKA